MASTQKIAAVMIAAAIVVTLFGPMANAVANSTGVQSVANESVTADAGNYSDLSGYNIENSSVAVEYNDSGTWKQASDGTDYEVATENGSIKVLDGSTAISDGDTIRVSYDYQATDGTTTTIAQLIPLFAALLVVGVFAARITNGM